MNNLSNNLFMQDHLYSHLNTNNKKKNIQPHTKNNNFSIKKTNKIITKKVPRKIGKNDEKKINSLKTNNEINDCEDSLKNVSKQIIYYILFLIVIQFFIYK